MSFEKASAYLKEQGFEDRIIIPSESSATVALAAEAIGCEPDHIAKTLSFLVGDEPIMIVTSGLARIDNPKYKHTFHIKAKMIPSFEVEELTGHAPGGVCPFGRNAGVKTYLDESLKKYETVYPACGDDHSAVKLSIAELEQLSTPEGWVDVTKEPEPVTE
jgi:prolyl-tRNA editing enzyme YbaK/EbsC (Cys-tRNA(Pro) deacylase)